MRYNVTLLLTALVTTTTSAEVEIEADSLEEALAVVQTPSFTVSDFNVGGSTTSTTESSRVTGIVESTEAAKESVSFGEVAWNESDSCDCDDSEDDESEEVVAAPYSPVRPRAAFTEQEPIFPVAEVQTVGGYSPLRVHHRPASVE